MHSINVIIGKPRKPILVGQYRLNGIYSSYVITKLVQITPISRAVGFMVPITIVDGISMGL